MTLRWAVRMPAAGASVAATLRLQRGIEVAEFASELWLRGPLSLVSPEPAPEAQIDLLLRGLPCTGRFLLSDDSVITPFGALVPVGRAPDGPWTPIARWFEPLVPTASLPASPPSSDARVVLRLVPADVELIATILLTSWPIFASWATSAPLARLKPLSFARASDDRALIIGLPLPPIPGQTYTASQAVLLPAGFRLEPDVDPAVLLPLLRGATADLVLFNPDGSYQLIPADHLVPASRSAVRMTESPNLVQ